MDENKKYDGEDRRRETRYPMQTDVVIRLQKGAETVSATSVNLSSSGMLVKLDQPKQLGVGEPVTCELKPVVHPEEPLPNWGVGNIVRVTPDTAAVQFHAASFDVEEEDGANPPAPKTGA